MTAQNTEYDDILKSVKKLNNHDLITVENDGKTAQVLILPEGKRAENIKPFLDEYLKQPERRTGTAKLNQLDSFIAHANRFKNDHSALFANNDMSNPSLTCVIDYHEKTFDGTPAFCEHKSFYEFPMSKEWQAWQEFNGKAFSQADFAAFIEDRIGDVLSPRDGDQESDEKLKELSQLLGGRFADPSTLINLSRGLQVNESSRVKSAQNLSTGETSIVYETEHNDANGAPLKIPNMFLIAIPVFVAGDCYRIAVRLRYRLRSGQISWSYDLYRIENVFEDAFEGACQKAEKETELPLFIGMSE